MSVFVCYLCLSIIIIFPVYITQACCHGVIGWSSSVCERWSDRYIDLSQLSPPPVPVYRITAVYIVA